MKQLYIIGGPMGVGKTTVCRAMMPLAGRCVFLDGDWCWAMHPFVVNDQTKALVLENIAALLNNDLRCPQFDTVIFCWVLHQQKILDDLLARLELRNCRVHTVSLLCSEPVLRARLQADVDAGLRQPDVIGRSVARLPLYQALRTQKLDVSALTPQQAARAILRMGEKGAG